MKLKINILPIAPIAALAAFMAFSALAQTTVKLAWDYEPSYITNYFHDPVTGNLTNTTATPNWPDTFVLRGTKQANAPLGTWQVLIMLGAMQTNISTGAYAVRTNYTVQAIPAGAHYFVMSASNSGGESPFSNTAQRKPGPREATNFSAAKGD